jgi:hypothetical protein
MNAATLLTETQPPAATYEKKMLNAFLLSRLHEALFETLYATSTFNHHPITTEESLAMDNQILQLILNGIIETGEYTLEGIARYTRIPFDIIYDVACGINIPISMTTWTKIASLYTQVRPDIATILFKKIVETQKKNNTPLSTILDEAISASS